MTSMLLATIEANGGIDVDEAVFDTRQRRGGSVLQSRIGTAASMKTGFVKFERCEPMNPKSRPVRASIVCKAWLIVAPLMGVRS